MSNEYKYEIKGSAEPLFIDFSELTPEEKEIIAKISKGWERGKQVIPKKEFIRKFKIADANDRVVMPPCSMPEEIRKHINLYGMCNYKTGEDIYLYDGHWYLWNDQGFYMVDIQTLPKEIKLQHISMVERTKDEIIDQC